MIHADIGDIVRVRIDLLPRGDEAQAQPLGDLRIIRVTKGTETELTGKADKFWNFAVVASHSGIYLGRKGNQGTYKSGTFQNFCRSYSVYRLVCRALRAIKES